jgi:chromosome segregation ATPase
MATPNQNERQPMMLTLGQAAKETGLAKSAISRAIKSGRLSAVRQENGSFEIDPAELFRVYPRNSAEQPQEERTATHENTTQLLEKEREERERERQQTQASIADLRDQIQDLKADRDQWRRQATALLTHQPEEQATSQQTPARFLWVALAVALAAVVVLAYLYARPL